MAEISKPGPLELGLLLFVAIIWGSAFSSIKILVPETGAFWAAALRVSVGFMAVLPFLLVSRSWKQLTQASFGQIILVALLNMVVPFILISWALNHVDAGVGSLLLATTPITAMVIGHFSTSDERITAGRAVAVIVAMSGILVLVGPEAFAGLGSSGFLAQLAIVLSGACYVTAGFVMRRIKLDAVPFTAAALGAGSVILILVSFLVAGPVNLDLSPVAWGNLVWLGVAPTGLAYLLRYWLVRRVGVSNFALAMNTVPIFGIVIAAVYLGEVVRWSTIVALIFVLAGLAIARWSTPERKPALKVKA